MTTGVVIGKFLPPHHGHKYLIDTALAGVDHLFILVCARDGQPIDGLTRTNWLREIHPAAEVLLVQDDIPDHEGERTSRAWAERTVEVLGRVPDVVFTSEDYGPVYSGYLGAEHVSVDPTRVRVPVSGTAVRADPARHWHLLDPCVRAWYVRRVVVVGAESTGTTTLARRLADHYATAWVPEYGREFCEEHVVASGSFQWKSEHFVHIATQQLAAEDEAARRSGPILVCDTDALATSIWHERYIGHRSPAVEALAHGRRYALSILTSDDIPFVQDGTRDGAHLRAWMTERFREELVPRLDPWLEVRGDPDARLGGALTAIDALDGTDR